MILEKKERNGQGEYKFIDYSMGNFKQEIKMRKLKRPSNLMKKEKRSWKMTKRMHRMEMY